MSLCETDKMSEVRGTLSHSKSISDMSKRRKDANTVLNRYLWLHKRLIEVEQKLRKIQEECPKKTGCYLRYGWMFRQPYGHGFPLLNAEKVANSWQHALADFYTMEANKLLKERDNILKKMYRLASRYYKITGEIVSMAWRYGSHYRKPWFKTWRR